MYQVLLNKFVHASHFLPIQKLSIFFISLHSNLIISCKQKIMLGGLCLNLKNILVSKDHYLIWSSHSVCIVKHRLQYGELQEILANEWMWKVGVMGWIVFPQSWNPNV